MINLALKKEMPLINLKIIKSLNLEGFITKNHTQKHHLPKYIK